MPQSLKERTVLGISWSMANQLVLQIVTLVIGIVLARLLDPVQFGLVGMVTVLSQFALIYADMGYGSALVHRKSLSDADLSTVFWVNLALGCLIAVILCISAPLVAWFYGHPILKPITHLVALNFIAASLSIVQTALLERELRFKSLFVVNVTASLVSGGVAIGMALTGWGLWSLVAQMLIRSIVLSGVLWGWSCWRPRWMFSVHSLKELSQYSLPLLGTNSVGYWTRNLDNLLIGKVWGAGALGLYTRAYALMLLPLSNFTRVISRVLFPSFAKIQHDKGWVTRAFLKVVGITALIAFPVSIGTFILAEPIILTLYGEKWSGSIELLRVLSLLGINQSIGSLNGIIYQSQGATMLQFKWGLLLKLIVVLGIVAGLPFGPYGVAIAYTLASLVILVPSWALLGQVIPVTVKQILREMVGPLSASLIMGVCVFTAFLSLKNSGSVIQLLICIPVGFLVYVAWVAVFQLRPFVDIWQIIKGRFARSTAECHLPSRRRLFSD